MGRDAAAGASGATSHGGPAAMAQHGAMDWTLLLSTQRPGARRQAAPRPGRTPFGADADRILFSAPFRRLKSKTQVYPLPDSDQVHTRLSHTIEVASVGRTLGQLAGFTLLQRHPALGQQFHHSELGDLVAAACLLHDLGNPPFGHSGEDAIGRWFRRVRGGEHSAEPAVREALQGLDPLASNEFEDFEGNAQGFRLATRLTMEPNEGGLRLTAAVLGAFLKYPQTADARKQRPGVAHRKWGAFGDDLPALAAVAAHCDLPELDAGRCWARHPLAYLVEAADDICYRILDLEDAFALGRVSVERVVGLLEPLAGNAGDAAADDEARVGRLRARAIGELVQATVTAFLDHEATLLAGTLAEPILALVPQREALGALDGFSRARIYDDHQVTALEVTGYEVIAGLLDRLVPAALADQPDRLQRKLLHSLGLQPTGNAYQRLLCVTDAIAAATDGEALRLYRGLTGMELPH
jgi:dGTPase